ncbi:hypothetical protein ACFQHV_20775 [Promicromonospora thailandica]|uniref:hypothetical protein n=1 Tax=Promicromonospora thailandica TaxID=765201 RepID=UPI0020A46B56|nr:hypothetical protein [Promicromonospora thailandica]
MSNRIAGFELRLPESWHVVPTEVPDQIEPWARSTAEALVGGAPAPERPDAMTEDVTDILAEQLADVAKAVVDTRIGGLQTAVLVRHPELGAVDAMVTVGATEDLALDAFAAQLQAIVESSEEHDFAFAGRVDGTSDAGQVTGLHSMISHFGDLGMEGTAVLEERVVLGVFPPGCADMVELTAIARSVGTFDDMPQEMLDLLAGLAVELEAA